MDPRLKVLLVWHGAAGGAYARRFEALVDAGVDLTVVVPQRWRESGTNVEIPADKREWLPYHSDSSGLSPAWLALSFSLKSVPYHIKLRARRCPHP